MQRTDGELYQMVEQQSPEAQYQGHRVNKNRMY